MSIYNSCQYCLEPTENVSIRLSCPHKIHAECLKDALRYLNGPSFVHAENLKITCGYCRVITVRKYGELPRSSFLKEFKRRYEYLAFSGEGYRYKDIAGGMCAAVFMQAVVYFDAAIMTPMYVEYSLRSINGSISSMQAVSQSQQVSSLCRSIILRATISCFYIYLVPFLLRVDKVHLVALSLFFFPLNYGLNQLAVFDRSIKDPLGFVVTVCFAMLGSKKVLEVGQPVFREISRVFAAFESTVNQIYGREDE